MASDWCHCGRPACTRCNPRAAQETAQLRRLAECYEQCGPRARVVLLSLAERIARGATEYGDDFERPASWAAEAQAERLDALIYQTVQLELPEVPSNG